MPKPVLRLLQTLHEQATAVELAEVLWLAQRVPQGECSPLALALLRKGNDGGTPSGNSRTDDAPETVLLSSPHEKETLSELHATAEKSKAVVAPGSPRALALRIAHPPSLPSLLVTARALRPLKRYRPNPRRQEIDEAATAERIAHSGLLDIVTRPERERWLDLALVVDDSGSMLLWEELCTELRLLFERLGAFRQVRTWGLRLRNGRAPMLSSRPFRAPQSLISPAVIDDPSGRTMTVVISDGASPGWRTGEMEHQLARWGSRGPTAIIHALPARMWRGSALATRRWSVHVPRPGSANGEWGVRDPLLPPEISPFTGLPIPVLEPAPHELAAWARMTVAGGTSTALPLWDPLSGRERTAPGAVSDDQAVRQFRRTASPEAYRLAAHLAAIGPLTIPVMRLVAEAVPWSATTGHLSEVFLGGLMRPSPPPPPDGAASTSTGGIRHSLHVFSFTEEAREILLDAVPTAEVVKTARQVSILIGELAGKSPEFTALLSRPDGVEQLPEHAQSFAWLGSAMLRRLGLTDAEGHRQRPQMERKSEAARPPESPRTAAQSFSRRTAEAPSSNRPYFFLSYAHTPKSDPGERDPSRWVHRFFRDLSLQVTNLTGSAGSVGFMDQQIQQGEGWQERISEALAFCKVFVPLYSPRYFLSEQCGREWFAFSRRVAAQGTRNKSSVTGIVPALWVPVPPRQLPLPAERLQFNHATFGDEYADEGFYGLIKLNYLRDQYERAVYRLAKRIVDVGEQSQLEPGDPHQDYAKVPPAFGPTGGTPREMEVSVLACSRSSLPTGRSPDRYGTEALDWNPYHPASSRPLADHTVDIVRNLNYTVHLSDFETEPHRLLAADPPGPALLLVDLWALDARRRRELFNQLATADRPWISVMVPGNENDVQLMRHQTKLWQWTDTTLAIRVDESHGYSTPSAGLPTLEAFAKAIPWALKAAVKNYETYALTYPRSVPLSGSGRTEDLSGSLFNPDQLGDR